MKLSSWPEIGSDGDVLLTPYVPKGITGYDDDDDTSKQPYNIKKPIQGFHYADPHNTPD